MFARTIVSRSGSSLLSHVQGFLSKTNVTDKTLLFALGVSPNNTTLKHSTLSDLVTVLTHFPGPLLGLISSPPLLKNTIDPLAVSCSVALLESSKTRIFRSTIPGDETISVGKWHRPSTKHNPSYEQPLSPGDWSQLWNRRKDDAVVLPHELRDLSSQGNLVISIDSKNPTRLLLDAIDTAKISLSATTAFSDANCFALGVIVDGQIAHMYRIISGDPSRGTLALESHAAPAPGSLVKGTCHVQFFYRDLNSSVTQNCANRSPFIFTNNESAPSCNIDSDVILPDTFMTGSEYGFVLSRSGEKPWKCTMPGAAVSCRSV
ncbi:hypothetical protein FISHEDRAFT_61419 [Fistulina hepatica ATCC 64428]|uniref:FIST domain-containing protein n=1 Tax=Fistulina hepatica ATCC 64428 TaxID=1128425 RepID=A0A0D7A3X7_9AGAR|nr:hypothetical protein FISHEDRAFT_61419 [Fistulina hepatica ATCC 64428]